METPSSRRGAPRPGDLIHEHRPDLDGRRRIPPAAFNLLDDLFAGAGEKTGKPVDVWLKSLMSSGSV
jgi:hypothetical protein